LWKTAFYNISMLSAVDIRNNWDFYFLKFHLSASLPFMILHEQNGIWNGHYLIVTIILYTVEQNSCLFCRKMSWQETGLTKLCIVVESTGYFSLYKCDIFIEKLLGVINNNDMFSVHTWNGGRCVDMGPSVAW
jgi:hypothetical protein